MGWRSGLKIINFPHRTPSRKRYVLFPQSPLFIRVWQKKIISIRKVFSRLFFCWEFSLDKFLKIISLDRRKHFAKHEWGKNWTSEQTNNRDFYFYLNRKNYFCFQSWTNFLTKTFQLFEKFFWQEKNIETNSFLFFGFRKTTEPFFLRTKIFNSEKKARTFFAFFIALFGWTEKLFCSFLIFFRRTNEVF